MKSISHFCRITRAMVSSTGGEGTLRLHQQAPDFIVPALRTYRTRADLHTWVSDTSIIPYLKTMLAKDRYAAIGEFHLEGDEADYPIVRQTVALAKKH